MSDFAPTSRDHTRWQGLVFLLKAFALQGLRHWKDWRGEPVPAWVPGEFPVRGQFLAESRTALWTAGNAQERRLQLGKVENLRRAARCMDGITVPAGRLFSFWRQVGRPLTQRGFVPGRELREGCLIPSVGGGLCQLSNALHDCALQAGLEIVERHAHSQIIPGSLAAQGRDATVFWNYVDLRFRARQDLHLEVSLDREDLTVRFRGERSKAQVAEIAGIFSAKQTVTPDPNAPASCASCGMTSCFRNIERQEIPPESSAVLVDECWPEFAGWLQNLPVGRRVLFVPLDGARFGVPRYGWNVTGFTQVRQFPLFWVRRSWHSRRLSSQGAARQRALLAQDWQLARRYARQLSFDTPHLTVTQSLLPFLWREGVLGGRTFDVLLTRWPLWILQEKLDAAARLHPESPTLADFRPAPRLVQLERTALEAANQVITPHPGIAGLFCEKATRIDWCLPSATSRIRTTPAARNVVFPASTLGRKGAYELRDAIRALGCELTITGPVLETPDFWGNHPVRHDAAALQNAGLVVLPSFVENRPRRLLEAVARGIPIIATPECGLEGLPGVTTVPAGNTEALIAAISAWQI